MLFRFFFFTVLIFSFSQCQNVPENTLIASPNIVGTTKFPHKEYAYIKTYSINRTWDLDSLFSAIPDDTTGQYEPSDTIYDENALFDSWIGERSIYNSKKEKAKTAQFIKKLNHFEVKRLQNILVEDADGMLIYTFCLFKYRDAIVFYNKNDEPVEWINFCFECQEGDIDFESENWEKLKRFFIGLGHPILEDK